MTISGYPIGGLFIDRKYVEALPVRIGKSRKCPVKNAASVRLPVRVSIGVFEQVLYKSRSIDLGVRITYDVFIKWAPLTILNRVFQEPLAEQGIRGGVTRRSSNVVRVRDTQF